MHFDQLPTRPPACSAIARSLREPLRGTAARTRGWLLVEQPGPWGRDGMGTGDGVGAELAARCDAADVRLLLMRTDSRRRPPTERTAYLVHSGRPRSWMEQFVVDDVADLLSIELNVAHQARPPGLGRLVTRRRYVVCTHGRKDACCAVFGRPVVRALGHRDGRVWESSHVGGDRFAANLVCLPDGTYYGHVDPGSAKALVRDHDAGRLSLEHFRGRSCDESVLQIADHAARSAYGLVGLEDVVPLASSERPDGDVDVTVRCLDRLVRVRLRSAPEERRLTACTAATWGRPDHRQIIEVVDEGPCPDSATPAPAGGRR